MSRQCAVQDKICISDWCFHGCIKMIPEADRPKAPGCRNCMAEEANARHDAKMPPISNAADYRPAVAIGIMPVRDEFKDQPPVYWPFCENHATLGMIAGFKPAWLTTPEGQQRLAALNP